MANTNSICESCGKPQSDRAAFREVVLLCHEQGWHVLRDKLNVDLCCCRIEMLGAVRTRLAYIRKQRSGLKRRIVLAIKISRGRSNVSWKGLRLTARSKANLVTRSGTSQKDKKAILRQLIFEDLVLWGGRESPHSPRWVLRDTNGNPHKLEDVLDSPVVREMTKAWTDRTVTGLGKFLSLLAADPALLNGLERREPLEEIECIDLDLEKMWRTRIDGLPDPDDELFFGDPNEDEPIDASLDAYFWPDEMPGED